MELNAIDKQVSEKGMKGGSGAVRRFWGVFAALCSIPNLLWGSQWEDLGRPYQPSLGDPFAEPWRWSRVDAFSNYMSYCISESPNGEFWIGAREGVLRYDGYRIEHSLDCGAVKDIAAYAEDEIYALSVDGLWKYDGKSWKKLVELDEDIWGRESIGRSSDGTIWVRTRGGVLRVSGEMAEIDPQLRFLPQSLAIDSMDRLWITEGGNRRIVACPIVGGQLVPRSEWIEVAPEFPAVSKPRYQILRADRNGGGMWVVAAGREHAVRHFDAALNERLIDGSKDLGLKLPIIDMEESPDGTLWFRDATKLYSLKGDVWKERILKDTIWRNAKAYPSLMASTRDGRFLVGGGVSALFVSKINGQSWTNLSGLMFQCEDPEGSRWYLGRAGNLVVEDPERALWREFDVRDNVIDTPIAAFCGSDGTVWVLGGHRGVAAVSYLKDGKWTLDLHPSIGRRFSHLTAYEDRTGNVYFGSGDVAPLEDTEDGDAFGAIVYRAGENGYRAERLESPQMRGRVVSIASVEEGEYWFGGQGLTKASASGSQIVELPGTDLNRWIDHVIAGADGDIWVAIGGRGVCRLVDGAPTLHTKLDGLRSNNVSHLLLDTKQRLWASTSEGISRFDGRSWSPLVLPESIRFGREEGTLKETRDGSIWINSVARSWFFRGAGEAASANGKAMRAIRYHGDSDGPKTYLGDFEKDIHGEGNVYLRWSGADYLSKTRIENLEYSYRVDDGPWSSFSRETKKTFLGLESGKHVIEVRSRDQDGNVDPSGVQAAITVIPLLWKRPWFIAAEAAVFFLIVALVAVIVRMRVRHMVQSREFKIWFFAEISHELKTPLSLILGPVESALRKLPAGKERESLGIARRNARKMLRLVEQLLEFQKVEMGSIQLEASRLDLIGFLRDTCSNFQYMADLKALDLSFESDRDSCLTYLDADKLQKIVDNLLSNAIKYTPDGGRVLCKVAIEERGSGSARAAILVEDSGVGISKKDQVRIFDPYHRAGGWGRKGIAGTGVGLSLARELVQICRGSIQVDSPILAEASGSKGTRFTVRIPLMGDVGTDLSKEPPQGESPPRANGSAKPLVLIVDDNADIRRFLRGELEESFSIVEAANGREGLQAARDSAPDLVVSDVMMPEMDGNDFCRALKSDPLTSHVPVIMLTAKSSPESELRGLEFGADDYLSKPVDTPRLIARIRNRLTAREELRARFVRETVLCPTEVTVTSLDETLLKRAMQIVEERIQDPELSVETLAEDMHLSRATLFRKLKAICGQTPTAFIATIRLKRSKQLLESDSFTIAEVSQNVGFSDSSYFSSRFKKEFGMTPTEYIATHRASGVQ